MGQGECPQLSAVQKLSKQHDCRGFSCHKRALEAWLKRYALKNQLLDSSQTYVVIRGSAVAGYYTLTYGEVQHRDCPAHIEQGMPERYSIPIVLLARLAVDDREAGKGLGQALLKDALLRAVAAADIAGARAVLVHAIDEEASSFYKHFGFVETPAGPLQLMISMQNIRASMGAANPEPSPAGAEAERAT